ncbi:MAG: bifunctional molybdopterin-guanine dinucleotide biosynthesis adaptor protein MobB/molybdopterin molybdotransferase MoeA [Gammaproteobacteria bacterium]|nr:bifunctional molybdopterin-guanine dinucleotide biosynthesis adaptor protein MobB/molybdopterin molybdotransferase MoeA [Gammaproteobacteria bacterium]
MQVFGVVGWKNNGKTTLVEKLIAQLTAMGYKVSSVKHAHHKVDIDQPGRDSYRHRAAGAHETLVATDQRWALMHELRGDQEPSLQELTQQFAPCDIIIVEGYKGSNHPKLEVVRNLNEKGLLADQKPNIVAIATDKPSLNTDLPLLDINNPEQIAHFVLQHTGLIKQQTSSTNDCYHPDQGLLPAETVWQRMLEAASTQVKSHKLDLDLCLNHRLAEEVVSSTDSPRFDNVAVDGYAFCYGQLAANDFTLPLMANEANAGGSAKLSLLDNHCIRVLTGARMPQGADTVVMQEDVEIAPGKVTFHIDTKAYGNWRPQGEDVKAGSVILPKGQQIRPQDIGLAAAAGHRHLTVYEPLKVALFSTGNEVYELDADLPQDGIYDVNRHMLKALYKSLHCEVTDLGILADDYPTIHDAIQAASLDHQLIVTSGGASTGSHDHVTAVLGHLGQVHAWRVAIKPGRPLAFGSVNNALFLGLPGNPVAANVCSLMFGGPLVRTLGGGTWQRPQAYPQMLGFDVKKKVGRREWLRVFQEVQPNGEVRLQRSASHGSGILTSLTRADGLVEIDEATSSLTQGSIVDFIPFASFGIGDA